MEADWLAVPQVVILSNPSRLRGNDHFERRPEPSSANCVDLMMVRRLDPTLPKPRDDQR